jgi:hypothetical protein
MTKGEFYQSQQTQGARNRPPPAEPWIWLTRELLESDAWRMMPRATRLVVDRIMIEHMAHAGTENGNLVVTYNDFVRFGVHREVLPRAISEASGRGLISVTEKGRASTGSDRWPSRYALGWLPLFDGAPALNRWKAWKPRPPIGGNIESSTESRTRENGANRRSLVRNPVLAPGTESRTRENEFDGSAREQFAPQCTQHLAEARQANHHHRAGRER